MAVYILDASAMVALLTGEPGADVVDERLSDSSNICLAHALNVCEVYYGVLRAVDDPSAIASIKRLRDSGLHIHRDLDEAFWMDVGRLKVNPGKLSIADCCAIALARKHSANLLTSDHHEMDNLVGTGVVGLEFIR